MDLKSILILFNINIIILLFNINIIILLLSINISILLFNIITLVFYLFPYWMELIEDSVLRLDSFLILEILPRNCDLSDPKWFLNGWLLGSP